MRKIVVILLLLLNFTMPTLAANWYWLGSTEQGNQFYIDNSSVRKNYYFAYVWTKIVAPDGSYQMGMFAVNHKYKSLAIMSWVAYDAYGNIINSLTPPYLHWDPIVPESLGTYLYYAIWPY